MPKTKKDTSKYVTYIKTVLKQIHPGTGIRAEALEDCDQLVHISLELIVEASNQVLTRRKVSKKTLSENELIAGVKLIVPGELGKHAISEGNKAVTKFHAAEKDREPKPTTGKRKPVQKSKLAGLVFPVTRVQNEMMSYSVVSRKNKTAAVFLAAVLEYLTAEMLELAGNITRDKHRKRISSRDVLLAIKNDEELHSFYKNVVLSGGVVPDLSAKVLPKKKGKKKETSMMF